MPPAPERGDDLVGTQAISRGQGQIGTPFRGGALILGENPVRSGAWKGSLLRDHRALAWPCSPLAEPDMRHRRTVEPNDGKIARVVAYNFLGGGSRRRGGDWSRLIRAHSLLSSRSRRNVARRRTVLVPVERAERAQSHRGRVQDAVTTLCPRLPRWARWARRGPLKRSDCAPEVAGSSPSAPPSKPIDFKVSRLNRARRTSWVVTTVWPQGVKRARRRARRRREHPLVFPES